MAKTLGYHYVKSAYGLWLPGDERGSWSAAWDDEIGFIEPHTLHPGDPARLRMAEERMLHPPVRLTDAMLAAVAEAIAQCVAKSAVGLAVAAASLDSTPMHLLIPYSGRDIEVTAKWLADQTTKAVHRRTSHAGPVWCKGKWCSFVFEPGHWDNAREYIERHNVERGRGQRPYTFVM
jgi:hypothetical protein